MAPRRSRGNNGRGDRGSRSNGGGRRGGRTQSKDSWNRWETRLALAGKSGLSKWVKTHLLPMLFEFLTYRMKKKSRSRGPIQSPSFTAVHNTIQNDASTIRDKNANRNLLTEEHIWARAMQTISTELEQSTDFAAPATDSQEERWRAIHELLAFIAMSLNKSRSLDFAKSINQDVKGKLQKWQEDVKWTAESNVLRDVDPASLLPPPQDASPELDAAGGGASSEKDDSDGSDEASEKRNQDDVKGTPGDDDAGLSDRYIELTLVNHEQPARKTARIGRHENFSSFADLQARIGQALHLGALRRTVGYIRTETRVDIRELGQWQDFQSQAQPVLRLRITSVSPHSSLTPSESDDHRDQYDEMDSEALRATCQRLGLQDHGPDIALRFRLRAYEVRRERQAAEERREAEEAVSTPDGEERESLPGWSPTQIFYQREEADVRRLLRLCATPRQANEVLDARLEQEASPNQLNQEGLAHVEESADMSAPEGLDADAQLDYDRLQSYLEDPACQWQSYAAALGLLRDRLRTDDPDSIIYRMPPRRGANPNNENEPNPGTVHLYHQTCFLAWAVTREEKYCGGICADHMGMGKTHEFLALMILFDQLFPGDRPTLLVTTNNLKAKLIRDAHDQLGEGWAVLGLNRQLGKHGAKVTIDPNSEIFRRCEQQLGVPKRRVVIVTSYTELSTLERNERMVEFFWRIILDEGHENRRSWLQTQRGETLKLFQAHSRWIFTGTLIVNSLADLCGAANFVQRDWWSSNIDRNRSQQYLEWKAASRDVERLEPLDVEDSELDADSCDEWDEICSSIEDLDDHQIQEKMATGWLCSHWPVGEELNTDRGSSMASQKRLGLREDGKLAQVRARKQRRVAVRKPLVRNPYNHFHRRNANRRRAFTYQAMLYWVISHVRQKGDDEREIPNEKIFFRTMCFLKSLVISRNARSLIDRSRDEEDAEYVACGEAIPRMKIIRQNISFSPHEQQLYEAREKVCGKEFDIDLNDIPSLERLTSELLKKAPGKKFRQVFMLTTSLLLFSLRHLKGRKLADEGLAALIFRIFNAKNGFPENILNEGWPEDDEGLLWLAVWGSPKFRWGCGQVDRICFSDAYPNSHRKLITMFHWPQSADFWFKLLCHIGVQCIFIEASLNAAERDRLLTQFQQHEGPMVLISTHAMNMMGFDLQYGCAAVITMEPSYNYATDMQAGTRVHRLGANHEQEFFRPHVVRTYLDVHSASMILKLNTMIEALGGHHNATMAENRDVSAQELAERAFGYMRQQIGEGTSNNGGA
ncbi:hypothetical protein KC316_g2512 [Hortaea werneckii]|nr:hypothetical protein KC324_g2500 [Hortaea werneckii]KAI7592067.1 hypothetical protein KC316_g2512 [Hortaea werneckii]